MKIPLKILIIILAAAILLTVGYFIFQDKIFNNQKYQSFEGLRITKIKSEYGINENIVVSGEAKNNSEITFLWNGKIGMGKSDNKGAWIVNFGKMPEGKYALGVIADDSPVSRSITTAQISVVKSVNQSPVSLIDSISNFLTASLSLNQEKIPEEIITIPQQIPSALQGEWNLLK